MKLAWTTSRLQKNGRPGQAQDGVDIHGADDLERPVAIQCKRTVAAPSIKLIREEIVAAEGFVPQPITLHIATTADPDSTLQQAVRILSAERTADICGRAIVLGGYRSGIDPESNCVPGSLPAARY
jgi:hypothetical protein